MSDTPKSDSPETPGRDAGETSTHRVREAVGVFHDTGAFEEAIDALMSAGFDHAEISLLASEDAVEKKLGHRYDKVDELEDEPGVPRVAYVDRDSVVEGEAAAVGVLAYVGAMAAAGTIVASGGTVGIALAGAFAAGGGGGLVGGVLARIIGGHRAKQIQSQLDHGGLLLWVGCRDEAHETRALDILKRCGGDHVHIHEIDADELPEKNPLAGLDIDPFLPKASI